MRRQNRRERFWTTPQASALPLRVLRAYSFANLFQPALRPGEFDAKNREPEWNDNDGRAGRYYHDDTDKKNGTANGQNCNSPRQFVGNLGGVVHQGKRTTGRFRVFFSRVIVALHVCARH